MADCVCNHRQRNYREERSRERRRSGWNDTRAQPNTLAVDKDFVALMPPAPDRRQFIKKLRVKLTVTNDINPQRAGTIDLLPDDDLKIKVEIVWKSVPAVYRCMWMK